MKALFYMVLFTAMAASISSCTSYGKEKEFNGVQLFYTEGVTEAEADMIGNYLVEQQFADGNRKSVQLNRNGSTFEFRMVVQKGFENDQDYCDLVGQFASDLSELLGGQKVEVHLCDEFLQTLKAIPMASV